MDVDAHYGRKRPPALAAQAAMDVDAHYGGKRPPRRHAAPGWTLTHPDPVADPVAHPDPVAHTSGPEPSAPARGRGEVAQLAASSG